MDQRSICTTVSVIFTQFFFTLSVQPATFNMPKVSRNRHRRNEVLQQKPELGPGQVVGRVIQACGENIYEVETSDGDSQLYQLPKRLRHVTFIKRGSFVFIGDDNTRGDGKVRGDIEVVVIDHFLNELRKQSYWPARFARPVTETASPPSNKSEGIEAGDSVANAYQEGEEEHGDEGDHWDIGMGNPNRRTWASLQGDSESDDASHE